MVARIIFDAGSVHCDYVSSQSELNLALMDAALFFKGSFPWFSVSDVKNLSFSFESDKVPYSITFTLIGNSGEVDNA